MKNGPKLWPLMCSHSFSKIWPSDIVLTLHDPALNFAEISAKHYDQVSWRKDNNSSPWTQSYKKNWHNFLKLGCMVYSQSGALSSRAWIGAGAWMGAWVGIYRSLKLYRSLSLDRSLRLDCLKINNLEAQLNKDFQHIFLIDKTIGCF
jgi:hypothetical protein